MKPDKEDYFKYKSEQLPDKADGKTFDDKRQNSFEFKVKNNLPLIVKWKSQGRSDKQIAFALDVNYNTYKKLKEDFPVLNEASEYGKEMYGMSLEALLSEKAYTEKHFKSIEKLIEKNNSEYSNNPLDIIANLQFNKLDLNIIDTSKDEKEIETEFDNVYKERLDNLEKEHKENE